MFVKKTEGSITYVIKTLYNTRENDIMRKNLEIDEYYATRFKKKKLEEEYLNLDNECSVDIKTIGIGDSIDGELRENPELIELRVKAMYMTRQKKDILREKIRKAIIIEDMEEYINFDNETVIIGSVVNLTIDDEEEKYTILGNDESDIENDILAANAPLVKEILGHKVNDTVFFNNMKIKILSVSKYIVE